MAKLLFRTYDQRGAAIVMVAISLVVLIGFSALAIDVGYIYTARNQLQNAADAAALAAARELGSIYQGMSYSDQTGYVCDGSERISITSIAQDVAGKNIAADGSVFLNPQDVIVGHWLEWKALAPGTPRAENINQPDAVHVIARRDNSAGNGPISTFFARALGFSLVDVSASATAALSGMSSAGPGDLELPVGISSAWFQQGGFCGEEIRFYPSDSCAGWTGFDSNPNTPNMRAILDEQVESPPVVIGQTQFEFTGGVAATLFDNMYDLFHRKAQWVDENGDPTTEGEGTLVWATTAVVYHRPGDTLVNGVPNCGNPNSSYTVIGFTKIEIFEVLKTPEKSIKGRITCNQVDQETSRGGGEYFGLKGSIPALVE